LHRKTTLRIYSIGYMSNHLARISVILGLGQVSMQLLYTGQSLHVLAHKHDHRNLRYLTAV